MPWLPGLWPQCEIFWSLAKLIFKETPREKAGKRFCPALRCSFKREFVVTGLKLDFQTQSPTKVIRPKSSDSQQFVSNRSQNWQQKKEQKLLRGQYWILGKSGSCL